MTAAMRSIGRSARFTCCAARRWPTSTGRTTSTASCTGEDMALCWDLHQRGWQVVLEPAAEVIHVGAASARAAFGATIDQRKLAADYAWFTETHGAARTRIWAAANSLGFGAKAIVAPAMWGTGDPHTTRNRRLLRIHAEHLFGRR